MTTASTETTGRRRFELKRRIGAGAFGEVFLAEQVSAGGFRRLVALKLLNETAARLKEASTRMRDEARILGRLSHRHIVEVLDLVQLGDRWAVVMAYVPGADLEQVLALLASEGRAVPPSAACAIGAAVARALHAAWTAADDQERPLRVVHRDIKPSNIRLTSDGEVKVLDFGVARVDLEGREAQTRRPGLIGTELYMAPERLLLEADGPEGDVYALASTVVELMRGEALGRSPVRDEAHAAFVEAALHDIDGRLEGPPEVVAAVVARLGAALAADPRQRPDAATLAVELEEASRLLAGPSLATFAREVVPRAEALGHAHEAPTTGTLVEGTSPSPSVPTYLPPEAAPATGRVLALAGVLGLAGVGIAATLYLQAPAEPAVAVVAPAPAPVAATPVAVVAPAMEAPAPPEDVVEAATTPPSAAPVAPRRPERPSATPLADAPASIVQAAPVERVSRAMIVVADVSGIEVACGDRTFHGTSSVRAVDFPAGVCTVRAERGGSWSSTTVRVEVPREVACTLSDGALACR